MMLDRSNECRAFQKCLTPSCGAQEVVDEYSDAELAFLRSKAMRELANNAAGTAGHKAVPLPLTNTLKMALIGSLGKHVKCRQEKEGAYLTFLRTYNYKNMREAHQDLLKRILGDKQA